MMRKVKRIALVFPVFSPHLEPMTQGILNYARMQRKWDLAFSPDGAGASLKSLQNWKGDGVIAFIGSNEDVHFANSLKIPVVNISASRSATNLATVVSNNFQIGQLAADHLISLKFSRFGYYGILNAWYSEERYRGFADSVEKSGFSCEARYESLVPESTVSWQQQYEALGEWLQQLELPIGILAVQDYRARFVIEACKDLGMRVPEDVSIVGVNDDPVSCLFSQPTLTSVAHNGVRVGFEAAQLLDVLIENPSISPPIVQISPVGVMQRSSTDTLAVEEPLLRQTIEFINNMYREDIGVEQIALQVNVSRRWLEKLFKVHLDSTPNEYLSQVRVNEAKRLLAVKPRLSIKDIAESCGFHDPRRLGKVFRRLVGMSPSQYLDTLEDR